ncbi:MAG: hypothetical protein ABI955_02290 [Nitrospirota bacterium]
MLNQAEELIQKTGFRARNALHVASALTFQAASGLPFPSSPPMSDSVTR